MADTSGNTPGAGQPRNKRMQPRDDMDDIVHSATEQAEQATDKFEPFMAFWGPAAYPAFAKPLERVNEEIVGLASRRAKALLDLPARLTACHTPQRLIDAQMHFFQDAAQDWQSSTERLWRAWTETAEQMQDKSGMGGGNGCDGLRKSD